MADIATLPMPGGTISPQVLDVDHYEALDKAVRNVLAIRIARETLAQLMDGLPLWCVFAQNQGLINVKNTRLKQHTELCAGAIDMVDEFMSKFNTSALTFHAPLLQHFQNADLGSETFRIRLVELVGRSIHCIAASIHHSTTKAHQGDIEAVTAHQDSLESYGLTPFPPHATLFYHFQYAAWQQYPLGASDMAGYWAEDRIFGGVVLFDRGDSGDEAKSIWLHSCRYGWTMRVWKLLDWQLDAMMDIFTNGPDLIAEAEQQNIEPKSTRGDTASPLRNIKLPFFCDIDNLARHDDWDAMALHNIHRDPWERKLPEVKLELCTRNTFDYPETIEFVRSIQEMAENEPASSVADLAVQAEEDLVWNDLECRDITLPTEEDLDFDWDNWKCREVTLPTAEDLDRNDLKCGTVNDSHEPLDPYIANNVEDANVLPKDDGDAETAKKTERPTD